MKQNILLMLTVGLLAGGLIGCGAQTQTRTYEVVVRNQSAQPLTVWLTKDGLPYERLWASPEDLAIESPKLLEETEPPVIGPNETRGIGPIQGKFSNRTDAVLRIYTGRLGFNDLLAFNRDSPSRRDLRLRPGYNEFIVEPGPGLRVERAGTESRGE